MAGPIEPQGHGQKSGPLGTTTPFLMHNPLMTHVSAENTADRAIEIVQALEHRQLRRINCTYIHYSRIHCVKATRLSESPQRLHPTRLP